ncbi:MAG: hypothetical protein U5R49_26480 [Deltaproteobacteria bacterium]|nr:hypothetical protein [Deltaproteobacteria bacterium]
MDFPEKRTDHGIFGKRREICRVKNAKSVRLVAVFGADLTPLDDQLSGKGVGVFPVDQDIGGNFTENGIAKTHPLHAFEEKWVGQMLLHKGDDTFVAFNQIGSDQIPIIIPVQVNLA